MISKDDLKRRLLLAAQSSGQAPPQPSQFQGLLDLAGDPNVPEAIRTSAGDAANKHRALATSAGINPHEYRSGGEAAEDQGKAAKTPTAERRKPTLGDVFSKGADALEAGLGLPPGRPIGPPLQSADEGTGEHAPYDVRPFAPGMPPPPAPSGMRAAGPRVPAPVMAGGGLSPIQPAPEMLGGGLDPGVFLPPQRPVGPPPGSPRFPIGVGLEGPPGPGFPLATDAAPGPGFPVTPDGQAPGPGFPLGPNAVPPPTPPPLPPDLGIDGVAPMPFVGGTSAVSKAQAPGPGFPISVDSPQKRRQDFDARRHAAGKAIGDAVAWPFRGGTHYDEASGEQVANGTPGSPDPSKPESPNDARQATPSSPSPGGVPYEPGGGVMPGGGKGAPGVPVSKPKNIPAAAPKSKGDKSGWGIEDGAPGPLGTVAAKGESSQWEFPDQSKGGGIEKTLGPPHQLFPMEKYTGPSQGNAAAGGGGSTAPDASGAPTYSREADALKPIDPPKPINPLAFALIKGGAALMASKQQFGQALGEGVGAGLEGYVEAQNTDFENLRKANEDARASRKESSETYTDTQLKRWIAGNENALGNRNADIRTMESDRALNLGEKGIAERGREADQEYSLGKSRVGIEGINAQTARGQLGVAGRMADVAGMNAQTARAELEPAEQRGLKALTAQIMETYPEMKANPTKAFEAAQALWLKMHPAPLGLGGGLDALVNGGGRPPIPDSGIAGAVPQ
jgi:hypothetical protein